MRNLVLFFVRYHAFFLFLLLEFLALFFVFRFNRYQQSVFLNSSHFVSGKLFSASDNISSYLKLRQVNEDLADELSRLKNLQQNNYLPVSVSSDTIFADDTIKLYSYIAASVINNTTDRMNNFITLNRGSIHGIEPEMGVIGLDGIVGVVVDVSRHFSVVMPVINKNARFSARLNEQGYVGSLVWSGQTPGIADLQFVPKHIRIEAGDRVSTSGYSSIFPPDVPIGSIREVKLNEGENFFRLKLELATDFRTLSQVWVIRNLFKDERLELEGNNE